MGSHEYLNTHEYPHSGYPRGYGAGTGIIFIQRGEDGYHTIRTYEFPFTSLITRRTKPEILGHVVHFVFVRTSSS